MARSCCCLSLRTASSAPATAAMAPRAWRVPLAAVLLGTAGSPAAAPFSCSTISIDCMCNWGSSGAWQQVGGLTKAPAEAQDTAEACERWCCTTVDGWKDSPQATAPAGKKGTPGTGRCQIWQYMPPDPTGKENLGCWAGITGDPTLYVAGVFHKTEWVGAAECLGIGSDWGTPFLVVLFVLGAGYLAGGAVYLRQKHGARGRDMVPHKGKWEHVHGLVLDGVAFAQARGGGGGGRKSGGGAPIRAAEQALLPASRERERDSGGHHEKRASGGKDAREKRSSGGKEGKSARVGKESSGGGGGKASKSGKGSKEKAPRGSGCGEGEAQQAELRLLTEQVEQDERLHQSQAKIKVIGLNG